MTADYGIKISKPGYDVKTADKKDLILDSELNSLKIWMTGSVNISVSQANGGAGTGSADVAHNLGYAPFYLVYFKIKDANKLWFQGSLDESLVDEGDFANTEVYSNSTNLHAGITVNGTEAAFTAVMYYIILIDKAYE